MNEYERTLRSIGNADILVQAVVYDAYEYWERANCTEDFCLQHADLWAGVIVLGSVNRVRWSMHDADRGMHGQVYRRQFKCLSSPGWGAY